MKVAVVIQVNGNAHSAVRLQLGAERHWIDESVFCGGVIEKHAEQRLAS